MAFAATYAGIVGSLQSLTPTSHSGQYFSPRNFDAFPSLDAAIVSGMNRQFDLDLIRLHEGPYITNGSVAYQTAELILTIGYCSSACRQPEELYRMMAEDYASIVGYLRLPATWEGYAFELNIVPVEDDLVIVSTDNNEPAGFKQSYVISAEWSN